jgi:DNA-binding NtrC family response regulator
LQAAISAGSFRSDLFYRLHVFPIEIPALGERKEDIRLMVEYFIDRYARKAGTSITTVDKKTLRLLESYPWPGNIRELQNVIERSVIVCETENFSVDESWLSQQPSNGKTESQLYLSEKVAAQEKEIIEAALRECQGRVFLPSGTAAKLGIARSTLESKIRSLKINENSRLIFGHVVTQRQTVKDMSTPCIWRIVISPMIPQNSLPCYHSGMRHPAVLFTP